MIKIEMSQDGENDSDDMILNDLAGSLMGYFGDTAYADALDLLRDDIVRFSETRAIFHRGFDLVIALSDSDCLELVQAYANRYVENSPKVARQWLQKLRDELFAS